jgi:hypothetical protein
MIQDILNKISPELISDLTQKVGLSPDKSKEAVSVTKETVAGTIGKEAASGNTDGILAMLNKGGAASDTPMFQNILDNLIGNFVSKLGLPADKARMAASFVLPKIMSAISGSKSGNFDKTDLAKIAKDALGGSLSDKADSFMKGGVGNLFKK